jgi:uncharacterized protein (DUF433 family)
MSNLSRVSDEKFSNELRSLVISNSEIRGGSPVFKGTRVPLKALFDYLETGGTVNDFLRGFPSITQEKVIDVLRLSQQSLIRRLA